MSASQHKKGKEQENNSFKKKAIAVVAIVVVVALVIMFLNSNFFYRNVPAVEVNGKEYSVADYNFYYYTAYYKLYATYYETYGDYAQNMMPSGDEMKNYAVYMIQETQALHEAAEAAGYTLSEAGKANMEADSASLAEAAEENGFSSVNKYLKAAMGKGLNYKIYQENMEYYSLAQEYALVMYDEFIYSDEDLNTYYEQNRNKYDVVTYRAFFVNGTENMDQAKADAQAFEDAITDEDSFAELALEYAAEDSKETYEDKDATLYSYSGQYLSSYAADFSTWLLDLGRDEGETTVVETANNNGYYVVYFVGRDTNEYATKNVRHILFATNSLSADDYESDAAYEEALAALKAEKLALAEDVLAQWQAGEASEESFAALADEYSEDGAEGGLYENVYRGQTVEAFDAWCYDAARKAGDVEIVETEFGYHVMYFIGDGPKYCDSLAEADLRQQDYTEWVSGEVEGLSTKVSWATKLSR